MPDEGQGKLLGAVDYLNKPVNERQLLERVGRLLSDEQASLVLVADDDKDVRELLAGHLRRAGHRVMEASDGAEALRVFYMSDTADGMRMRTSLDGGKSWDSPVTVIGDAAYGDVAIDGKGRVHVAVSKARSRGVAAWGSPDNAILYTVSVDGKTFSAPIKVNAPGESTPFYFVNPTLAADDSSGWIYVAYAAGSPDGRWDIQLAATHDGGKTWKRTKVNDDASCANHMVPNLAIDPADGTLHITFLENRGGGGHLAYTTCKPAGGGCAPVVRASPDMAAYELVRHSSMWLGEYDALVLDPTHRVVHAVWTHTAQEGEHPIGRLRHATRSLDVVRH
jgi:hypothetical protein